MSAERLIQHYSTCHYNYPEKPRGEGPQKTSYIDIGDGETVKQCMDCGACVIIKTEDRK